MAVPATTTTMTLTGIAAFAASMPFGVSNLSLFLGGACFFAGCCAKTGVALYAKLNGNDPVSPQFFFRRIAALLCCVPLAAVASGVLFFGAHMASVEADTPLNGLLLILGVRGPEGFQWLMDRSAGIFERFAPSQKPGGTP